MKICDATMIIAICNDINCPSLFYEIFKLGHILAIPSHLLEVEILEKKDLAIIRKLVKKKIVKIISLNSIDEIKIFQSDYPGLGLGEIDVFLSYDKLKKINNKVYCIFDERRARTVASKRNVKYKGLIGLLDLLKERNIMTEQQIKDINNKLKKSKFRYPKNME